MTTPPPVSAPPPTPSFLRRQESPSPHKRQTPNPISNLPPIFVISLARAKARREAICQRLNALGLHYEVVDAVDGKTANPAEYQTRLRQDIARRKWGRELLPGEIGCYLSHYNLWQRIAAEQIPQAIVLEDDAEPNADFIPVIADVLSLNVPWDVVHLAAWRKDRTDVIARGLGGGDYVFGRYFRGLALTHAYMISLAGAQKSLHLFREISNQVDLTWMPWWRTGLLFYCIAPKLAQQTNEESLIGDCHYRDVVKSPKLHIRIIDAIGRRYERIYRWVYRKTHPVPKARRG